MRQRGVNVRVANMSLGGTTNDLNRRDAMQTAGDAGILFTVAAGNGGSDQIGDNNDAAPVFPASYPLDNIISVAATDRRDLLASYSNFGMASVDLAAPGTDILSTYPRTLGGGTGYITMSGTSMAAPHVAGVLALAFSVNPDADIATVRTRLLGGVDTRASLTGLVATGGRLNANSTVIAMSSPSLVVIGDRNGNPTSDTIIVRYASDPNFIEAIVNGVQVSRVARTAVSSIAVYGLGENDNIDCSSLVIGASIYGGNGNDTVAGGSGADLIYGGNDNDWLAGNDGIDTIYGNFGDDNLMGGLQGDDLKGGIGNDTLTGGDGNDLLYGGDGTDSIRAGAGNDCVEGKGKSDTIYGSTGNDTIDAGAGDDLIYGEDGDDWIYVHDGAVLSFHDTVYGGAGYDRAQWDAWDSVLEVEEQLVY